MSAPYFVHGIQLVNTGGELCDACGQRKAIGESLAGHLLCPRCAGWAAHQGDEMAREKAESQARRIRIVPAAVPAGPRPRQTQAPHKPFRCGHPSTDENSYTNRLKFRVCRTCKAEKSKSVRASRRIA